MGLLQFLASLLALTSVTLVHGDQGAGLKAMKDQLLGVAKMPEESQKALLNVMGEGLLVSGQLECNPFGGKPACAEVPRDSKFARTCAVANEQVDCAFKSEALQEISKDPHEVMREKLAKEGFPPCDACFDALHSFWCGQTVPTCGTFEEILDEILPVISQTTSGRVNPVDALQQAAPKVLEAFSLGLPCREMCEAITATCSCGRPTTFGQVMSILEKTRQTEEGPGFSTNMSASTAQRIFASVWEQPVCHLFAPRSMPGFMGVCDVAGLPPGRCGWCKSKVRGPQDAEEQIVAQLAESVSGMMQSGLQRILDLASSSFHGKHAGKGWEWQQEGAAQAARRHHPQGPHSAAGTVWVVLLLLLAAGAGAAGVLAWYVHKQRHAPAQYMDLNGMGYNPPVL